MKTTIRSRVAGSLLAVLALAGCDILDVENPNNLVEESIRNQAAASAVVNGSEALVYSAISNVWQVYLLPTDDLVFIGSRDGWLELELGNLSNPNNEFIDAAFPAVAEARWMADEAVEIIDEHIAEGNDIGDADLLRARANLYAGLIYMIIGETMEDFAFSDKTESGPPVGPTNMQGVFDDAVGYLNTAVTAAQAADNEAVELQALMIRARAQHSRAVWGKIKPSISGNPLVNDAGASADAMAALALLASNSALTPTYSAVYDGATIGNSMASWINDRKENNIDSTLVVIAGNAAPDGIQVVLMDPIDDVEDPVVDSRVRAFRSDGLLYPNLDLATAAMMNLILAEAALEAEDSDDFAMYINATRGGLTDFSGQIAEQDMLIHARRVNLLLMGTRLHDMYRFGITDSHWLGTSVAITAPGTLFPISIMEIRANCYLNGTCSG
ncbi:MAG: hypothetical protein JSU98_11180 [Gemmatimonadales bacterium]|nr:MAG: hypothetical protein JSU98_11180 [Gemmatimonadales bacterium]